MGNAVGRTRRAKVMKIDGETLKFKTPARVSDVVKDYPGHVLLDSEAVKNYGPRAKPLGPHQELKPKRIYFLVEPPKIQLEPEEEKLPTRRVQSSGIRGMNAKDRLEFLMLSKRSVSDLSLVKPSSLSTGVDNRPRPGPNSGPMRVKMRVPKAQLEKLMEESNDQSEVAEKIMNLYMSNAGEADGGAVEPRAEAGGRGKVPKAQRKRVSFSPVEQEEIREEAGP